MVFHFVVAESDVYVDGFVLSAFEQELFVNFGRLFVVASQVMDGG